MRACGACSAVCSGWRRAQACIDQERIEESLAVLPVFLSGCKELLVVAGPSYTQRLWCVMEIYTFLRMGGR